MKAVVVLTPSESKHLIAKAVVQMEMVQRANLEGTVVLHPSSSTFFVAQELTAIRPTDFQDAWVCGIVVPKGLCAELRSITNVVAKNFHAKPGGFMFSWIIQRGQYQPQRPLDEILASLSEKDVYIKGVNAVDSEGRVGILLGSVAEGTIGRVINAAKTKGFKIIYPVGLEKLIPTSVKKASKELGARTTLDYTMGMPVSLVAAEGVVVTELDAIKIISGAQATVIAKGGLGGAEGAVTLLITGEKEEVGRAIQVVEAVKNSQLPDVKLLDCKTCHWPDCPFQHREVPW